MNLAAEKAQKFYDVPIIFWETEKWFFSQIDFSGKSFVIHPQVPSPLLPLPTIGHPLIPPSWTIQETNRPQMQPCQSFLRSAYILLHPPKGTIHKGRPQNFRDFGPPPPPCQHSIVLKSRNLPYCVRFWVTPSLPLSADIICEWPPTRRNEAIS